MAEHQIVGGKHFLILGPESGRIWWFRKVQDLQRRYHCQWTFLRGKNPKWIFHNLGTLLRPLEIIPVSRERVVLAEWQVRTILGACISKAKVITVQSPQYRLHALICDFLDLANLSVEEEAALATNWIDDRLEGLKLQNFASATMAGPVMNSLPKIRLRTSSTLLTNASLWAHSNNYTAYGSPSMSFFTEYAFPVLHVTSGHPRWRF